MDGSANCHNLATCTNKEKGYDCNCKTGFIGDGTTECKDIDECLQGEDDCSGRDHLFFPFISLILFYKMKSFAFLLVLLAENRILVYIIIMVHDSWFTFSRLIRLREL